ncbi:hypothetical protein QA601_00495 [Chitinispirillales bacterium ANBcel5]|uniref:hypothetical protein n=1 Tax=Cellulosispirillum alkaliphilum TaxID=3039283 RepID=UPI002A556BF4|nr:hypothetical protein [Chitinispirillales bacterium ANBcel5]
MIHKVVTSIVLILILNAASSAELIRIDDDIIYDPQADQYWYGPRFYHEGLPEELQYQPYMWDYSIYSGTVAEMNRDPALTSHKWGDWYVAGKDDITTFVENNLDEIPHNFIADVTGMNWEMIQERFFDKQNPANPDQNAVMRVVSYPEDFWEDMYPDEPMPPPFYEIEYVDHDDVVVPDRGLRGIWVTARGEKTAAVPEPSLIFTMVGALAGLFFMRRKGDKQ